MQTCILFFTPKLILAECSSLLLEVDGSMLEAPAIRQPEDIHQLQAEAYTYIVLPSECINIYHLPLPNLSAKKAKAAIEFAMEGFLPEPLDQVHLSARYNKERQGFEVHVIDRKTLQGVLDELEKHGVDLDGVFSDASLLKPGEAFYDAHRLVVNSKDYQGAIAEPFYQAYEKTFTELTCISRSTLPTKLKGHMKKTQRPSVPILLWLAKRLKNIKPINLAHGDYRRSSGKASQYRYPFIALSLCATWLITVFISIGVSFYQRGHEIKNIDKQIQTYYQTIFPGSPFPANPRLKVEQVLKKNPEQALQFWKFYMAISASPIELENLRYQNQMLVMAIKVKSFTELQNYKSELAQAGLKVKQRQSSEQSGNVLATLELKP